MSHAYRAEQQIRRGAFVGGANPPNIDFPHESDSPLSPKGRSFPYSFALSRTHIYSIIVYTSDSSKFTFSPNYYAQANKYPDRSFCYYIFATSSIKAIA